MGLIPVSEFLESRDNSLRTHKGIVIDNNDPKMKGRVRVFIKDILEGKREDLPWVSPEYPSLNGGSPSMMSFSVPELGAIVAVEFKGGSPYVPVYKAAWITEDMAPNQLFGEDYPNTMGSIDPSGSFLRSNTIQNYSEYHHNSGAMVRFNNRGDIEVVAPRSLLMRVDGDFVVNNNYWQSCGGGMGNIIEELLYAVLGGPYLKGLLNIVAILPGNGNASDPNYISVNDFADDLVKLSDFAKSLSNMSPDMSDLESIMYTLDNRPRIQKSFSAFNGIEGLVNIMFMYFGLFGIWNSNWLGNSEDVLNATIKSLQSPIDMEIVLLGNQNNLTEQAQSEITSEIVQKMIDGFGALAEITPILKYCVELRDAIGSVGLDNPKLLIDKLPKQLNEFVLNTINTLFDGLMKSVADINPKSQIAFLDRFGLSKYFSSTNSSTEMIRGVVKELLDDFKVDSYELGMYGHIVGRAVLQDQKDQINVIENTKKLFPDNPALVNKITTDYITSLMQKLERIDVVKDPNSKDTSKLCSLTPLVVTMVDLKYYRDKIMKFLDDVDFDSPVGAYYEVNSEGINVRKVEYIGYETVRQFIFQIYNLRNDPNYAPGGESTGDSNAMAPKSDNPDVMELASQGLAPSGTGLAIPGTMLCYMGSAIGNLCRAANFFGEAIRFLGNDLSENLKEEPKDYVKNKSGDNIDTSIANIFSTVYKWFIPATIPGISSKLNEGVLSEEINTFLVGLDLHG